MNLKNSYGSLSEPEIRSMTHEELIQAVLRMFDVSQVNAEECYGSVLLSDELADAFRGRK